MKKPVISHVLVPALATALSTGLVGSTRAGTTADAKAPSGKNVVAEAPKEESVCDKIWGLAQLYKSDSNPIIEELNFTGRYQGQYYYADGDDASDDDWENRRFRLGLKAKLFNKHVDFNGEMFSNLVSGEDFYAGLKNFNLAFKANDAFVLTLGKVEPHFGYDYNRSDTQMVTFERTNIVNQFRNEYTLGATVSGKVDKFDYYAGGFSNEVDKEFGSLDGGWTVAVGVGYDLKEALGADLARVSVAYLHSEHDAADTLLTNFDNGAAATFEWKQGQLGVVSEAMAGFGRADNFGFMLMPTYDITKKLQVVARYQLGVSSESNGFTPQSRYERRAGAAAGDTYNAGYLGLNYYICGHKLKLMSGVEYANLSGDQVWTGLAGVRVSW